MSVAAVSIAAAMLPAGALPDRVTSDAPARTAGLARGGADPGTPAATSPDPGAPGATPRSRGPEASGGAGRPGARPGRRRLAVSTADGVELQMDRRGRVAGVRVAGTQLRTFGRAPAFSVRLVGGTPNLLRNPGLEQDGNADGIPDGWDLLAGDGSAGRDTEVARGGEASFRFSTSVQASTPRLATTIPIRPGTYYTLSAWMKVRDLQPRVASARLSAFRLRFLQIAADGSHLSSDTTSSYSDTTGWTRHFVGFRAGPRAVSVRVTVSIQDGHGTAWVDDLSLRELFQRRAHELGGTIREGAQPGTLVQQASIEDAGLALDATYRARADHILVRGTVSGTAGVERGFRLAFTLPVDAAGWSWGDYARRARVIEAGESYAYLTDMSLQTTSRYPWSVIGTADGRRRASLSLALPLDEPRIARMEYTPGGLSITFDLAVSSRAKRVGPRASFAFVIYTSDPRWGFRAATQKYVDIFPGFFTRRSDPEREGGWYFRASQDALSDAYRDYGLGLHTIPLGKSPSQSRTASGRDWLRWDDERGIYATAYTHHWAYYSPRPSASDLPTYSEALRQLRADAALRPTNPREERRRDEAAAALRSSVRDYNGRLLYEPFLRYLAFWQNLDALPGSPDWKDAVREHQMERAVREAASVGGRLDGIHLDSTSGMKRWAGSDDHHRPHWEATTMPLTFSYQSGLVTLREILPMYREIRDAASFAHERGMLLSANFNAGEARPLGFLGADQVDYFGIERGLLERAEPDYDSSVDSFAMLKRTLAHQRPVSTFDYRLTGADTSAAEVRERLELNLFYGIFPGGPALGYGPDDPRRELYATYTPLFRELARAGWEPVTRASSSDPEVWVERFGSAEDKGVHFTLRNETATDRTITLTVDVSGPRAPADGARAIERITGERLDVAAAAGRLTSRVTVPAGTTRLLSFTERP